MNEVLRENGRRLSPQQRTGPSDYIEIFERGNLLTEGCKMVTYSDLFEFVIMLIAFATFIYKISKKNNRQPGNWRLFKIINQ